jgi:hypothetical protein
MAEAAVKEQSTDIATIVETNPVAVLINEKTYTDFYQHIKAEVDEFKPDISTATGRKQIASLAYKVTRTKTAIDAAGKKLNEDARKQINKVDEQRRKIRSELDDLATTARKPLTEWEEAEEKRVEAVAKFFDQIQKHKTIGHGECADEIKARIDAVGILDFDPGLFMERSEEAEKALADTREYLALAYEAAVKAEADARELDRLRAEQEARIKAEREASEKAEAERLHKEALDRAAAEAKRREEAAAERARAEEKRLAEEAIAKAEQEKQAAIEKAEAEKMAMIREQERKEVERKAEAEREAAKQAKREANKKHRAKVTNEAESAIRDLGVDASIAKQVIAAVIDGKIPHVELRF